MNVWLTQSDLSAKPLARQIVHLQPKLCPLFKQVALDAEIKLNLNDTAVVLTSKNAIKFWCAKFPLPKNVVVMGPASAQFARDQGMRNISFPATEGSEAFIQEINFAASKIIIASAKQRRGLLEQELAATGKQVQAIDLYENILIADNLKLLLANIRQGDILVVSSQLVADLLVSNLYNLPLNWITISSRLADFLYAAKINGNVFRAKNTILLAETINKCYLDQG